MTVIDEPHDAVAASRCLTARSLDTGRGAVTAQHPRRCAWCAIDLAELTRRIEGWNAWADPKDRGRSTVYERHAARTFVEWSRKQPAEAEALIVAAQGLEPLEEHRVGGSDPLDHRPDEDRPAASFPVGQVQTSTPEPPDAPQPMAVAADTPPHDPAPVEEDVTAWM